MRPELESIYLTAPIGLGVLDTELRFRRVNQRLAEMNGLPIEAHLGRTIAELLPDLAGQAEAMLRRVLETGEAVRDLEVRGQTPAQPGVERIWLEQITPLRDAHGRVAQLSIVAEEVTERRRAEAALERSEETRALAMEAAGLALWEWDVAGNRLRFAANWEEILGYEPHELPTSRPEWQALMHPDDREGANAFIQAHAAGKTSVFEAEYRLRHASGRWVWVASRGRVVARDPDGRPLRMIGVGRDVTEAKLSEARLLERESELRRSQARLQVALEAGRMGVWDWSPGSQTAFWSPEVWKLLGLPPQESPDAFHFLQIVHPDDRAQVDAEIARVLASGGEYESEFRIVRADGEVRWLVSRGRVSLDEDGRGSRLVGVNFDITERKLVEQAMQEADTRRMEFLAMLAHELRNPLAPIVNAVRLLEKAGDLPDSRATATEILRRQTAHMARLVDDLLELSRITQGRIELRVENVLVATSVFQAAEAARPQARERNQTIDVDVPPGLDLVADPARLTQIVSNLVVNAVKYTPEGGHVVVTAQPDGHDGLSIVVQDDGPGISPELQPRLFELFTQDPRTLDRSQGGLGIGLALVKRLTELHGGKVRCESAAGAGARFVVSLPRKGRREQLRGSQATATSARITPLPILVVDDNRDATESLALLLRLDGHRVDVAHDGEEALAAAGALHPRVVLLDLGLPKLDGLAVARALRADERFASTIIVAMSGYAQPQDRRATTAAGFDGHLAKPVELAAVYAVIESALR